MNGVSHTLRRRSANDLSNEICELFGQQFAALHQGLAEVDLEQYLERRRRIHELHIELKASVPQAS
jgi:hypothetical protein